MTTTIENYSAKRMGSIWTLEDHLHLCHVIAEIDRTAIAMVRRAQDKNLAAQGTTREMVSDIVEHEGGI